MFEAEKKEEHQKALLGGLERLVGVNYPTLTPRIPNILMQWYQADILTEDVIKQWGTHVSMKYVDRDISKSVRMASEPFLKVSSKNLFEGLGLMIGYSRSGSMKPRTTRRKRERSDNLVGDFDLLEIQCDAFNATKSWALL